MWARSFSNSCLVRGRAVDKSRACKASARGASRSSNRKSDMIAQSYSCLVQGNSRRQTLTWCYVLLDNTLLQQLSHPTWYNKYKHRLSYPSSLKNSTGFLTLCFFFLPINKRIRRRVSNKAVIAWCWPSAPLWLTGRRTTVTSPKTASRWAVVALPDLCDKFTVG